MIDTTQLTQLISAFRVETEKESISPETVGSLLQNITDLLAAIVLNKHNLMQQCLVLNCLQKLSVVESPVTIALNRHCLMQQILVLNCLQNSAR